MIISKSGVIPPLGISEYAWSGLRRFQNTSFVTDLICKLHSVPKKHVGNARRQAEQIRYCLIQAREYFDASLSVTLSTKPTLLYYSIMSLALAEVLIKNDGNSNLDNTRKEHKHHGLVFVLKQPPKSDATLSDSAALLEARPHIGEKGGRCGTFDLWHQSCRELPLAGAVTRVSQSGSKMRTHESILFAADNRLSLVPKSGLSLLDCIKSLPGMMSFCEQHSMPNEIMRANLTSHIDVNGTNKTKIIIHPSGNNLFNEFCDNIKVYPGAINQINLIEYEDGGVIEWTSGNTSELFDMNIPHGTTWNSDEIRFWTDSRPLNEFGYLYVALFICGNYARYYPDKWILDVEKNSSLALAVEELVRLAESRMPLLSLSEMGRSYLFPRST